jgi:Rrf2 family protein
MPVSSEVRTLLRRDESYAIHALIAIAETSGIHAAAIAEQLTIPRAYLSKVLRKLVEAGLIESRTGRSGGVHLKADPNEVSLLRTIECVSGLVVLDTCQTLERCITHQRKGYCHLNRAYLGASLEIRSILDSIAVADLAD